MHAACGMRRAMCCWYSVKVGASPGGGCHTALQRNVDMRACMHAVCVLLVLSAHTRDGLWHTPAPTRGNLLTCNAPQGATCCTLQRPPAAPTRGNLLTCNAPKGQPVAHSSAHKGQPAHLQRHPRGNLLHTPAPTRGDTLACSAPQGATCMFGAFKYTFFTPCASIIP